MESPRARTCAFGTPGKDFKNGNYSRGGNHHPSQLGRRIPAAAVPRELLIPAADHHPRDHAAGAVNPRHSHEASEQVWIALEGEGELLLGDDRAAAFGAGDVARFGDGDLHGFRNSGTTPFSYISVPSPPVNFRGAYERRWNVTDD